MTRIIALTIAAVTLAGCQTSPEMQNVGAAMLYASEYYRPQPVQQSYAPKPCFYRQWGGQIIQQCW
jgi:hypothetical protein